MQLLLLLSAIILQTSFQPNAAKRSLLLFGNKQEPLMKQQWLLLEKDSSGLKERAVEVKMIHSDDQMYKKYGIDSGTPFTIILIGKDGGEKYRSNQLMTSTHLFALIDAMPMRQAEMQKKQKDIE